MSEPSGDSSEAHSRYVGDGVASKIVRDSVPKGDRLERMRVNNVMGSCAGAGSGDFHMYRHSRRNEMLRVERIEKTAKQQELDEEFERSTATKRKECEERTAKNAEKRRKKKEATKRKAEAVKAAPFDSDGSFLEKAAAMLAAKQKEDAAAAAATTERTVTDEP